MFERFTNRARRVVVLAQEEARRLDHNYIGTEHLLLGLLSEGESIASRGLASVGITLSFARQEVVERVGRGKTEPAGRIPFTPRAKKVLELSLRAALQLHHNYIGPEHILLGLIREGDGVAAQILLTHSDLEDLRAAVVSAMPAGGDEPAESAEATNAVLRWLRHRLGRPGTTSVPFRPEMAEEEAGIHGTPAAEAALREAATLAGALPVGTHHLLLAALSDPDSAASSTLAAFGVDLDELKERLRSAQLAGTSDEQPEEVGRRQMELTVADDRLTIVLTDPVIVAAARDALSAVHADGSPEGVIWGEHPEAAGLAKVWLELRATLDGLGSGSLRRKQVKVARRIHYGSTPDEPPLTAPVADDPEPGESGTGAP